MNDIKIRADPVFVKEIEDIILEKIKNGTWKKTKLLGSRRITKAIRNLDNWYEIKMRVISANFEDER